MQHGNQHRASERIRLDLIEADVDMAFGLVDDALEEFHDGNLLLAKRALRDGEKVLTDIDERLHQLDAARRASVRTAGGRAAQGHPFRGNRMRLNRFMAPALVLSTPPR